MRSDGVATRERLVIAGERLFAENGINVPLVDVQRVAEQRNKSALHYYFGSRDGLLAAILDRHVTVIDAERVALLDEIEEANSMDLAGFVTALVVPTANRLRTPSGRNYLLILPQVVHRMELSNVGAGLRRTLEGMHGLLDGPAADARSRTSMVSVMHAAVMAERARQVNARQRRPSHDRFVGTTIDMLIGALGPTRAAP